MSKRFLTSVAAIALIAGVGAVNAQGTKNEGGGAMSPSAGAPSSHSRESATPNKGAENPSAMKGQRAEDTKGGGKDMKTEGREHNKAAETNREKSLTTGQAGGRENNMKSEGRDRDTNMKSEGRDRDTHMKAEGREGRDRDNNMKAEGREGRDRDNLKAEGHEGRDRDNMKVEGREGNKAAETNKSTTTERTTTTGQAGAAAKLSTEQRTKITSVIRNQHVSSVNNVNFSLSVGTRVPREGVTFHTLPTEVVTIYPEWRGFKFILVHDEIVVIDPNTYEIVAVLNA